jgi:hypothetical protein
MQRSAFFPVLEVPSDLTVVESRVGRSATVREYQGHPVNDVVKAPISFSETRGSHQEQCESNHEFKEPQPRREQPNTAAVAMHIFVNHPVQVSPSLLPFWQICSLTLRNLPIVMPANRSVCNNKAARNCSRYLTSCVSLCHRTLLTVGLCFISGLLVHVAEAKLRASGVFLQIDRYIMADRSEHAQQSTRVPVVGCKAVLLGFLGPGGEFGRLGY